MDDSSEKPSHESIVDTIKSAHDSKTLAFFGDHIKRTRIPKGHDAIIEAWELQCAEVGLNDDQGVVDSVRAKQQAEEAMAALKAKA
jgi:hypothetical protein